MSGYLTNPDLGLMILGKIFSETEFPIRNVTHVKEYEYSSYRWENYIII